MRTFASVAELADALARGASGATRGGSNPSARTLTIPPPLRLSRLAILAALTMVAWSLAGCAIHASTSPATFTLLAFYGRWTDCPGQPIPAQLIPQVEVPRRFPEQPPEPPPCRTLEVGAKSYADLVGAIGGALAGALVVF